MTQASAIVIIIFGSSNVFYMQKDSRLEFLNEFIILCCIYHYYLFTHFVPDPVARYTMGYSLIGFTLLALVINLIVMLQQTVKKVILIFKFYKSKLRK